MSLPKSITVFVKPMVKQRFNHLSDCLLDNPISNRRNSKRAFLPVIFFSVMPQHGFWSIAIFSYQTLNLAYILIQMCFKPLNGFSIHSRTSFVCLYGTPSFIQVGHTINLINNRIIFALCSHIYHHLHAHSPHWSYGSLNKRFLCHSTARNCVPSLNQSLLSPTVYSSRQFTSILTCLFMVGGTLPSWRTLFSSTPLRFPLTSIHYVDEAGPFASI